MKKPHRYVLALLLALLAVAGAYGLPGEAEAHSELAPDPMGSVPASLDEQIYTSAVVVLASLLSVGPDAEFATGQHSRIFTGGTVFTGVDAYYEYYRPMQMLRFRVHEYLKGSGPDEIVVEVRHFDNINFTSLSEALAFAAQTVADRNSGWDDRPGILFLNRLSEAESYFPTRLTYVPSYLSLLPHIKDSENFGFTLSNTEFQDDFLYTIDTLSRAWLPSLPTQEDGEQRFMTSVEEDPPPVISRSELRARIAEIDALERAGESIEGYEYCLYAKFTHDRELRSLDGPWEPRVWREGIGSGLPAGSELYRYENKYSSWYDRLWVTGPLAELFEHKVVDDDSDPSNGHFEVRAATRPLPLGTYHVNFHWQHGIHDTCDFHPDNNYLIAEVVADPPSGVLHEAFFDPTEQGADDLSPAEFIVDGSPTSIEGVRWTGSSVELAMDPFVPLAGSRLDFIALDGSVSLSLPADDATANNAAGTLSWPMPTPPWQAGDRLMLRVWSAPLTASPPAVPAHERISAAQWHTCGLRADGETICWGIDWDGELDPPQDDSFVSIGLGSYHACGLRENGEVACWGTDTSGRASPPEKETFTYISVGGHHTCGLRTGGGVVCWGRNDDGQSNAPADNSLVAVSAGLVHTCGLRADGTAACWGEDRNDQSNPPESETFVAITAGWDHTCGLRGDGDVVCWGEGWDGRTLPPPGERFEAISAGGSHTCGLRAGGDVMCWGEDRVGQSSPPSGKTFSAIDAGADHTCGLLSDGDVLCWGGSDSGQSSPPRDWRFESIASGSRHTCGLLSDGAALCWGSGYLRWSGPLEEGVFESVTVGAYHICGLREDGVPVCWGSDDSGQSTPPPGERFVSLALGGRHSCGLKEDGAAVCWGEDRDDGQSSPPTDERFVSLAAGWWHTCGLREDGVAVCWGVEETVESGPPEGERFVALTAGWAYTCGLREDGAVVCWSYGESDRTIQVAGERFVAMSAGGFHTCGLLESGEPVCWGGNEDGESSPPEGERFVAIAAGESHTCGLRDDGVAICWGDDSGGKASAPSGPEGTWP